jgi:hypothetical protein
MNGKPVSVIQRIRTVVVAVLLLANVAGAQVGVRVGIDPLPAEFQEAESAIRSHIVAATEEWIRHFRAQPCTIDVRFSIRERPARGSGRSLVSTRFDNQKHEGKYLSEEGVAHKLRTGDDPNGSAPDIEITFEAAYFRTLWFDPDPKTRTARMPDRSDGKLDGYTVILHELGHAFGFNGFRNQKNGELPGEFMSMYDRWVKFDGTNFFFHGPQSMKLYGKPVPLAHTSNNYHHVAEDRSDPKLADDLMNGITFAWSRRYFISPLDITILNDCGLPPR